ncbi:unnamed protein product [Bursaphelenchus okinawaensis]|uniref:Sodium leak channel NALCN n=1 Tax=Bursaphelenchus okinawaensis TaxID=465554 RepID=A0A811JUC1_9BILA|nr:unnamed protein product [Bursaphelenchus okinawaensis]CAG9084178.1 unnamed protein product [Bursaphelenchus okinawaensis]
MEFGSAPPSWCSATEATLKITEIRKSIQKSLDEENVKTLCLFVDTKHMTFALKVACFISLITVCLHTPKTLDYLPGLEIPILTADFLATAIFSLEALLKVNNMGYFMKPTSYFRDRWCQFDAFLLLANWLSLLLHVYKLASLRLDSSLVYHEWFGIIRCARPMVIVRLLRLLLTFKVPTNRIENLLKRSSAQIKNVTVFLVFFMVFYAIMGIQLFGRMDYRCVVDGTDPRNVTINDLAIPDTMCSKPGGGGYQCPPGTECMKLHLNAKTEGFYGMFDDFGHSVFTVYMAASEEGWVYVLYDCMDSLPTHYAILYFITLIFFLAWLVKNVFIAVITETFAEIRVQFSEMWTKNEVNVDDDFKQKIEKHDGIWTIVRLDTDPKINPRVLKLQQFLRSIGFQCCVVGFVLANSIINASFVHYHDESDATRRVIYYYIEVGFTIAFNVECAVKILAYGFSKFWKRNIYKFELILCLGSSLNIVPFFYERNFFTYFQVFRLLRLIKASPMLEDFVYKIFSPGKKLGGLVIFTILFVVTSSAVSLQLFCYVPHLHHFETFPQAFMCMFQIITQEGWPELVVDVLRMSNDRMVPFVAIYFVAYHLFVTLIVLSLFVAVILDNLEMDEELKKVKQLKAKEATTSMRTTLPLRLRVFERFPTRPQMVKLKRVDSEFQVPRMRDSFTHQFVNSVDEMATIDPEEIGCRKILLKSMHTYLRHRRHDITMRHVGPLTMKSSIQTLVHSSCNQNKRDSFRASRNRHMNMYENMTENGDVLRAIENSTRKDLKLGEIDIRALQHKQQIAEMTRTRIEEEMRENHPYFDRPLFMVGRDSKVRRMCKKFVHARYDQNGEGQNTVKSQRRNKPLRELIGIMPYIDWCMVIVTLMSCASMLFESPWPPTGENLVVNNFYLQIADYLFVLAMTIELALKIVADGLFFTPNAVVRDFGGIMTIFIYFTSVIFLLLMPKHIEINSIEQFLMICRAMRPLRIYTLVPHIRRVVVELFRGFKEILLVTIFMIVIMFIFGSFGVQTVGGKLAACNDLTVHSKENCTGVFWSKVFVTRMDVTGKDDPEEHPQILVSRVWTNPRNFNFDHIGHAMLALFETLSYKGWNVVRDILMARIGPWAVVFIHIYVFIGCMIGLTLFVGVVIANYTENRGTALLTVDQRRWHDLKARLKMAQPLHVPPKPAESSIIRRRFYEITMSKWFNKIFAILVLVNSSTLLAPWSIEEEESQNELLYYLTALSGVVNVLFTIEIFFKTIAFTIHGFWQSRRNRIDLLITALGCLWVTLHFFVALPASVVNNEAETSLKKFTYTYGYIVVILRFFTFAGRNNTLKMLMLTVVMSMFRSFFIIIALAMLVLFYAYTGVILFGMVKYGQAVSKHVNFRSGSEALVVLFRSLTGEDWNDIMHDTQRSVPFCYWRPGQNYWETDCGNYYSAVIYFCSFYLIITYIVRNLLVAIIMENFSLFYSSEEDALLSYSDIRNFQMVWNMVDIEQRGQIPVGRVKFLLRLLKGRLEVDPAKDRLLFKHMCYEMEKLHNGDDVSFHDVLYMLSYRSVDIRKSLQLEELLEREELEYIIEEEVAKQTIKTWLECCLRKIRCPDRMDSPKASLMTSEIPDGILRRSKQTGSPQPKLSNAVPIKPFMRASTLSGAETKHDTEETEKESTTLLQRPVSLHKRSVEDILGNHTEKRPNLQNLIPLKKLSLRSLSGTRDTMFHSNMMQNSIDTASNTSGNRFLGDEGAQKPLQLSARELPDLEEMYEDTSPYHNGGIRSFEDDFQRSPTSDSSGFRPISPSRLNLGQRTPRRKVSSVMTNPMPEKPSAASIHLFYHSEPLHNVVTDIKSWWCDNLIDESASTQ